MFNDSKDKRIENYIKILQLFKKENDSLNTNNITDTDFNQMNRDLLLVQYNIINRDLMNSLKNNDEEKVSTINKYYTDLHQKNEILKKTNKQLIREIDLLQKELKNNTKQFEKKQYLEMEKNEILKEIEEIRIQLSLKEKQIQNLNLQMTAQETEAKTMNETIKNLNNTIGRQDEEQRQTFEEFNKIVSENQSTKKELEEQIRNYTELNNQFEKSNKSRLQRA
jgi:chromosome segregation ATPase